MVPAQGLGVVGKIHLHIYVSDVPVVHSKYVVAAEGAQVQAVVLAHYPVGLGVKVVKEQLVSLKSFEQGEEHIQVGAPGRYHKTGLLLDYGAFYHCLGGDEAHAQGAADLLHIAVLCVDVQQGGKPSAVFGGYIALEKVCGLYRVIVEDGEEAHEVPHVIDGGLVHKDEVLVHGAAAHHESGGAFAGGLHAGHHLDDFYDIRLSKDHGDFLGKVSCHGREAHFRPLKAVLLGHGRYARAFQHKALLREEEVVAEVGGDVQAEGVGGKAKGRTGYGVCAPGHLQCVITVCVCDRSHCGAHGIDHGAYYHLSGGGVLDITAKGAFLRLAECTRRN